MSQLLSIVIPAYNIEQYIARCLDSLINQTYKNIEIIVVDDGSKDNTSAILDEYALKDRRIKVIHKVNEGVSIARLTGMKRCEGDYIGFVDGDDTVDNDMFELLMNNALKYDADISHCGYAMDFPDGHSDKYYGTGKVVVQDNETGLKDLLSGKFIEPGLVIKIYKKELIHKLIQCNIMDYSIKNFEDLLVNYLLFKESNISVYEDVCKYHYILRKSSAATSISKNKLTDPLKVMKIILDDIKDNNNLYNIVYNRFIYILIQNATQILYKDIKKDAQISLKKETNNFSKYNLSKKTKYMAIGVTYLYPIYYVVRKLYDKVTKVDKKFEV